MKILEMRLSGFGRFQDLTLNFPGSFKLILGGNEAGKTTIVDAFSGVLFGFRRNQKNLRERYQPRQGEKYSASVLFSMDDGTRFLVGRDFQHDRLEIFRGQGVRLEPLPEAELEPMLLESLGLHTCQVFESTILIRQAEANVAGRDRLSAGRLAEAFGRKLKGGDEDAGAAKALQAIRDKLAKTDALTELELDVAAKERTLAQIDQGYQSYAALVEERDRLRAGVASLEADLNDLTNKVEGAKLNLAKAETRTRLVRELSDLHRRIAKMDQAHDALSKIYVAETQREQVMIEPEALAKAEELANQLAGLDAERRFEEEGLRQYQAEVDLLEREIASTRGKLAGLDPQLLSAEVQNQLTYLLPLVNENSSRLGELFPQVDRVVDRLRVLKTVRFMGFVLSFLTAAAAIGAREILPRLESLALAGGAGLSLVVTAFMVGWSARLNNGAKRLSSEIDHREGELKSHRQEVEQLLHGKTASQFQAELEASRLYRNDLWHLEQALAQKKANQGAIEKTAALRQSLDSAKMDLAAILTASGCRDLEEMRSKLACQNERAPAEQAQAASLSETENEGITYEEAKARADELEERLATFAVLPEVTEDESGGLLDRQNKLAAHVGEARMRLAELATEIQDYQEFILVRDRFEVEGGLAEAKARLTKAQIARNGLALAAKRLAEAIFEAGTNLGPELQEQAGLLLGEITGGRYREVQIELTPGDPGVRLRAPETGTLIDPAFLSSGANDQLNLAIRLALAYQLTRGHTFPLILDDPFASFDRERLILTARVLVRLARTHQVIWFARDQSLGQLIRDEAGFEPEVEELRI